MTTIKRRTTWQAPPRTVSAFLKALGVYLLIVGSIGAWIGGSVWASATGQEEFLRAMIICAPFTLGAAFVVFVLVVWVPVMSLWDHFKGAQK